MSAQENLAAARRVCCDWCARTGKGDPRPWEERLAFVGLTESGWKNYANDGAAFADDFAAKRPGWAEGLPVDQRRRIRDVLRRSLDLPHDAVGNNGGSTGPYQQLSQDYVAARFPGKTWGWGSMADTMDIGKATVMFLDRLQVTDNPVYRDIRFAHPGIADVLRVQQPLVSESSSRNYSAARWAEALALLDATQTPPGDWFAAASAAELLRLFA